MANVKLTLNLDKDLKINSDGKLVVKISSTSGNTLEVKSDGLYAKSVKGVDGSTGKGYEGRKILEYMMLGYGDCFYPLKSDPRKIICTSVVHRIFDATISKDGAVTLNDFREVDTVFVGDFFRVPKKDGGFTYYIITKTTETRTNNSVTKYEKLGDL